MSSGATAAVVAIGHPLTPEDRSRAEFYALLAQALRRAARPPLLRSIARARADRVTTPLAAAWNRLVAASGAMDAERPRRNTPIFSLAWASATSICTARTGSPARCSSGRWRSCAASSRRLDWRVAREVVMLEDHLSALFETMRLLVVGDATTAGLRCSAAGVFRAPHRPWAFLCCAAIRQSSIANYYARVAELTEQFMALDRDALAME